ncbi:MAG: D-galactarate dehydratase [Syntrophus sp. (in: bacteria)]|nr:D-galactarate dehydratase [Syntrophus sp. (in: bacteria)]
MYNQAGGSVILAETTELIGAEHLIAARAVNPQVSARCYEVIRSCENAATVMQDIEPHTEVELPIAGDRLTIRIRERIKFGHKFAIRDIKKGALIMKYGESIGIATRDIRSGQHVHVHNLESARGRGDKEPTG